MDRVVSYFFVLRRHQSRSKRFPQVCLFLAPRGRGFRVYRNQLSQRSSVFQYAAIFLSRWLPRSCHSRRSQLLAEVGSWFTVGDCWSRLHQNFNTLPALVCFFRIGRLVLCHNGLVALYGRLHRERRDLVSVGSRCCGCFGAIGGLLFSLEGPPF
jgi:hypothetical protein